MENCDIDCQRVTTDSSDTRSIGKQFEITRRIILTHLEFAHRRIDRVGTRIWSIRRRILYCGIEQAAIQRIEFVLT